MQSLEDLGPDVLELLGHAIAGDRIPNMTHERAGNLDLAVCSSSCQPRRARHVLPQSRGGVLRPAGITPSAPA
eukprot:4245844-Prymnesium_polylepis.2